MGVHDYRCSVCGTPGTYHCGEKSGTECEQEGIGEDQAVLDLFFFSEEDAPEEASEFEEARSRALRVETRPFGYDWGDWEFVPSLNYRELLMDDDDATGIWAIRPFDEDVSDGTPVAIEIDPQERVWVVNYCPPCHALFAERKTPQDEPCLEYLRTIAEQLEMEFDDSRGSAGKAPFIAAVRERVARRRPSATK
ncbi:hypothetical protein [Hyalangium minutum]|uniref:Uncharacterized protein n=1 Tax=Hyalangium minutum TaxID=394096 RepID=A0A085WB58_9BACT|nr:hypothetical protein [Hyalangium minutum]KFE64921.1 hypothetical protein DB31_1939 [Hyalangium minutum]